MKKNLLAVIILALVLVNLILTAVLVFSIIPQTKKSNELIDQVCAAINIELEGGQNKDSSAVPIEEIAVYNITDNFTVNLADNGDGKKHYAVFSVGLSVNKTSESYATYGGDEMTELTDKETIIRSDINTVVAEVYRGGVQRRWTEGCEGGDLIQDAGSVRLRLYRGREFLKRGNGSTLE